MTALLSSLLSLSFVARFIERRAVSVRAGDLIPMRPFVTWGWLAGEPFLAIRLPSWRYERAVRTNRYEWGQLVVAWSGNRGWFTYYMFGGGR